MLNLNKLRGRPIDVEFYRAKNPIINGRKILGDFVFKVIEKKATEYGIYKGEYTEFEKFKSSNKQRCVSLKNSSEMAKRTRHPALLRKQERDMLLQDSPMHLPSGGAFTIILSEGWSKASQDWNSLCKAI